MSRVKRGTTSLKKRRNILRQVKGYRFGRSKKVRVAKEAIFHAGAHAFRHRRSKKRDYRNLWALRINAAARPNGYVLNAYRGPEKKQYITRQKITFGHCERLSRCVYASDEKHQSIVRNTRRSRATRLPL